MLQLASYPIDSDNAPLILKCTPPFFLPPPLSPLPQQLLTDIDLDGCCIITAKEIELDELKSELNAGKERILALESELESRDMALKNALNTKEAIKDEKVITNSTQSFNCYTHLQVILEATLNTLKAEFQADMVQFSSCKSTVEDEKKALEKELDSQNKKSVLTKAEYEAEKVIPFSSLIHLSFISFLLDQIQASLQAQIAVFKSKKITLEQQLHVTRDSLESEKSRCRSLNDAAESRELKLLATQQELEESKEQSVSLTKKAEESGKQVKIILSSLNKMRAALTEKENVS